MALFKRQHFSNLKKVDAQGKTGSSSGTQCSCSSIIPTATGTSVYNSSPFQEYDSNQDGPHGPFGYKWKANAKRWQSYGLSSDFFIRVWSHDRHSSRNDAQSNAISFRIINLCSDQSFERNDLCNCDKFIEYNGEFRNNIFTALDAKVQTVFPSHSRNAFKATYLIYKAEHDPNASKNSEMIDSHNWKAAGEMMYDIDFEKLADAAGNALSAIVNVVDTNFAEIPDNVSDFLTNLSNATTTSIEDPAIDHSDVNSFTGWDTLKANIPLYFVAAHAYSGIVETGGRADNDSRIRYRSAFYWNFSIANSNGGYDINGNLVGNFSQCCNEDIAYWSLQNALLSGDLNGGIPQMLTNMESNLNQSLIGGKYFNFQNTSFGPQILSDGFLDLKSNPDQFLTSNSGSAYTLSQCGCETFLTERINPTTGEPVFEFLTPQISLEPQNLCPGNQPLLRILNADQLPISSCDISIKVSHETNGVIHNTSANGTNPTFPLNVAGLYTITFTDLCTGCTMSSQITLYECSGNDELDCLWSKLNTYPNPLPENYEILNIKLCLGDCVEDPSSIDEIQQLYNTYFPATLEILDLQGNTLLSNTNLLQGASLTPYNCYETVIDLSQSSIFPLPSGIYLVKINFATGETRSRILRVN